MTDDLTDPFFATDECLMALPVRLCPVCGDYTSKDHDCWICDAGSPQELPSGEPKIQIKEFANDINELVK